MANLKGHLAKNENYPSVYLAYGKEIGKGIKMDTLSLMLTSAPLDSSSFTWSRCLYSVAQIMAVHPPSSWRKHTFHMEEQHRMKKFGQKNNDKRNNKRKE